MPYHYDSSGLTDKNGTLHSCAHLLITKDTSCLLITHLFYLHGIPDHIISDQGFPVCVSVLAGGVSPCIAAYHPETNSQSERANQVLEQYLWFPITYCPGSCNGKAHATNYHQNDWALLFLYAEFAYNNADHASAKMSLLFANYGVTLAGLRGHI